MFGNSRHGYQRRALNALAPPWKWDAVAASPVLARFSEADRSLTTMPGHENVPPEIHLAQGVGVVATSQLRTRGLTRRHPWIYLLLLSTMLVAVASPVPRASGFFNAPSGPYAGGPVYYNVSSTYTRAGYSVDRIHEADQAVAIQDLSLGFRFLHDNARTSSRLVVAGSIDGPGGVLANATLGCTVSGNCTMRFDTAENWNMGTGVPGPGQFDFLTIAAHEFGHWVGLDHSTDVPSSDSVVPPMMRANFNAGTLVREPRADDTNGFKVARGGPYFNMVANSSFEYDQPFRAWNLLPSARGAAAARYCSGSVDLSCFVQFNGNGAGGVSLYQDIHDYIGRGPRGSVPWHEYFSLDPSVMVRPNSSGLVSLAVFFLNTGGEVHRDCAVTAGVWTRCVAPTTTQRQGNTVIRLQVINHTPDNLSVDDLRFSRG